MASRTSVHAPQPWVACDACARSLFGCHKSLTNTTFVVVVWLLMPLPESEARPIAEKVHYLKRKRKTLLTPRTRRLNGIRTSESLVKQRKKKRELHCGMHEIVDESK